MIETKQLAKEFVLPYFNLRESFFNTAWDYVNSNFEKVSSAVSSADKDGLGKIGGPLAFGGTEERGAVKAILIFADGFRELPLEGDFSSLVKSIQSACSKYHAEEGLTKEILNKVSSLENRIAKFMKPAAKGKAAVKRQEEEDVKGYVIYLPTASGIGTEISGISETKMREDYLQKKNNYQIFVFTRNVFVRSGKELKSLQMDERIYKLLVIFLRQKDMLVPPIPLYRKAWSGSFSALPSITDERDISDPLKASISELRTILKDVQNFEITKARFQGYICKGKFPFCVIILKSEEKKFIISEAEDSE